MNEALFLTILLGAMGVSFFLSGIEIGLLSLPRVMLREMVERGSRRARSLWAYLERPGRFSGAIRFGKWTTSTTAAVMAAQLMTQRWGETGFWVACAVIPLVILIICELLPRALFRLSPKGLTLALANLAQIGFILLSPVFWVLETFSLFLLRTTGGGKSLAKLYVTRQEIKALVQEKDNRTSLSPADRRSLAGVYEFSSLFAREIMLPIPDTAKVNRTTTATEILDIAEQNAVSRLPVVDGNSKIIGIVNTHDILFTHDDIRYKIAGDFRRAALFLPPTEPIHHLLRKLCANRQQLAVIREADGKDIGIVSLEDALARIVKEIEH